MTDKGRAGKLHAEGQVLDQNGDEEGALAKYNEALALDPERSVTHYNIGLIYKYRRQWRESFVSNQRAVELAPDDEAANWNLAIAATALREWAVARRVWASLGMNIAAGEGPIEDNFGTTPVRLNPDGNAEVVWAQRVCPVRARIRNVPWPESGFRHGDIVLHDGAAVGYRLSDGKEKPVFNVFELFERSAFATFVVNVVAPAQSDVEALIASFDAANMPCEDWGTVRTLCRQCSEGKPYDSHPHDEPPKEWRPERRLGIGAVDAVRMRSTLDSWASATRRIEDVTLALR
jgi:tetratricopeptide (TPR) repeat protein